MTSRTWFLLRKKTIEEIEGIMEEVLQASIDGVTEPITINASSKPDGRASSGIVLTTEAEKEQFLCDCREAIEELEGIKKHRRAPSFSFRNRRTEA